MINLNNKQQDLYNYFKSGNGKFRNKHVNRIFKFIQDRRREDNYNPSELEKMFYNLVVALMKNYVKTKYNNKLNWHELLTVNERKELAAELLDAFRINGGSYKQPPKCDEYGRTSIVSIII